MARVVASTPTTAQLYRLDQLIAAGARRSLWLTDAYFVGTTLYVQVLKSAEGVALSATLGSILAPSGEKRNNAS